MLRPDLLTRSAKVIDGPGAPAVAADAVHEDCIQAISPSLAASFGMDALVTVDARGLTLAPDFIEVHTHDNIALVRILDPETILDMATYDDPVRTARGIFSVWVNGVLSYTAEGPTGRRAGCYLPRGKTGWTQ